MIDKLADLGELFQQFRKSQNLTQIQLEKRCGDMANRSHIAHLEQGRRVPPPSSLRAIAEALAIPHDVWAPFASDDSHQRHQFEAALTELVGRPTGLRSMALESVKAAETIIDRLFSGTLTSLQAFDTLNSALLFYAVPPMSHAFFDRYFNGSSFQSTETFDTAIRRFQTEAIRLFSNFAEAYRKMNTASDLEALLAPLAPRPLTAYAERTVWESADPTQKHDNRITPLAEDKLEFLGYISVDKYKQQRRKRETLARYLQELADAIRKAGAQAVDELTEKRRRKLDSLLRELGSTLAHTPMSPLFAPNPAGLEAEAKRMLREEKDEVEMAKAQQQALANLSHYIAADKMDVYVATSMRTTSDFISVNRFAQKLFRHDLIAPLRLRYFNPTQSWIEDRVAKGLVEALMLRRAGVTLYMAHKTDSFGKDSEASVCLGQGKPVIVYVPKLSMSEYGIDSDSLMSESDARIRERLFARGKTAEDLDDLDHDGLFNEELSAQISSLDNQKIAETLRVHWADFALLDEYGRIRGKDEARLQEEYSQYLKAVIAGNQPHLSAELRLEIDKILTATTVNFELKRAKMFREVHPLALQLILSTGVLNGILVSRSVDSCAVLLRGLVENKLELELKLEDDHYQQEEDRHLDNYRLIEKTTRSTIRVISRNALLSNALEAVYQRL